MRFFARCSLTSPAQQDGLACKPACHPSPSHKRGSAECLPRSHLISSRFLFSFSSSSASQSSGCAGQRAVQAPQLGVNAEQLGGCCCRQPQRARCLHGTPFRHAQAPPTFCRSRCWLDRMRFSIFSSAACMEARDSAHAHVHDLASWVLHLELHFLELRHPPPALNLPSSPSHERRPARRRPPAVHPGP